MSKKENIKKWMRLVNESFDYVDNIGDLRIKRATILEKIFPERVQPTKGFFISKPMDFIIPKDWGHTDPCTVTVYRNARENLWDDDIVNLGTDDDIKIFCCPHFQESAPCTMDCQYKHDNNECFKLDQEIKDLEEKKTNIISARHAAWKRIFQRDSK